MRAIAHAIAVSYDKSKITRAQLEFYIKVMRQVVRVRTFPQVVSRFLSKLIIDWLELTSNNNPEIILQKSGTVSIDVAAIGVVDRGYKDAANHAPYDHIANHYLNLVNQGKCYLVHTGSDATFDVQLRVVNALEPVLTSKELKFVEDMSETAIMHIPTGEISIGNPFDFEQAGYSFSANIIPGNYKICAYLFCMPHKFKGIYIVLSKTDQEATNNLAEIYSFC